MPDFIANVPELRVGSEFYYQAFWMLTSDRPAGMGPAPIPSWSIRAYCRDMELTGEESAELHFVLRRMDDHFLAICDEKQKKETAKLKKQAEREKKGGGR